MRDAVPPHEPRHSSGEQRYRVGPWLVAVGTLLIMAAVVLCLIGAGTHVASELGAVTPSPTPGPCPTGGVPPCLH